MRLSMPSESHFLNPKAEDPRLRERSLLLALRQGCRVLVQDGLDCLHRPWNRLPTPRPKLWEEGVRLRRLLVEVPVADLRDLPPPDDLYALLDRLLDRLAARIDPP